VVLLQERHLGLIQGCVQGGQEFVHILLAPAAVTTGGGFDLGAIHSACNTKPTAPARTASWALCLKTWRNAFWFSFQKRQRLLWSGAINPVSQTSERCSRQAASSLRVARMR